MIVFFQSTRREFHGFGEIISVPKCVLGNEKVHTKDMGADILYTKKITPSLPVQQKIPKLAWDNESIPLVLTEGFKGTCFSLTERDWGNIKRICSQLESEL